MLVPQPTADAIPINEPASVELDPGERGTVTYDPEKRVSSLVVPIIAASKYRGCIYEVRADADTVYGPARIPPTDIDDLQVCFIPALRFSESLTVQVTNLAEQTRTVNIQPIGWEPGDGGDS